MDIVSKWLSTKTVWKARSKETRERLRNFDGDDKMTKVILDNLEDKDYEIKRWPKVIDLDEVVDHEPSEEFEGCTDVVTRNCLNMTIEIPHHEFDDLIHNREAYVDATYRNFNQLLSSLQKIG